jgi:hypothetical protein
MANVAASIKLESNSTTSDNLLVDITSNYGVTVGGIMTVQINAILTGSAETILAANMYETPAYVWIRNMETTAGNYFTINIGTQDAIMLLQPGEWAFFPWNTTSDIKAFGVNIDQIIEYGCFA